jgi:ABC-type glycerol-3-phosphate transport system permease component
VTQTMPGVTTPPAAAAGDVPEIEPRVPRSWWRLIALTFGAVLFLFPFYYMIIGSLQKTANTALSGVIPWPGNLTLRNYSQINAALSLGKALLNSAIFTGGVLLGTLVFGVLAGYALAQLHFRGRGLVFGFMLLLLMVPFQLLIIPRSTPPPFSSSASSSCSCRKSCSTPPGSTARVSCAS